MFYLINRLKKITTSFWAKARERLSSHTVAIGYYNINNFGDQLTPDILAYYGLHAAHCPNFRYSKAICVGSILHLLPKNYTGYILGSGLIKNTKTQFPTAKFLLVRGHLTRKNLGLTDTTLVGDPGLIVDQVYKEYLCNDREWDVGIVPHYKDCENIDLKRLQSENNSIKVNLIDVRRTPEYVTKEISKCVCILSSSLHGLIVADSLGIPNKWIKLSNGLIGGNFKFDDYYSCFDIKRTPTKICRNQKLSDLIDETELLPSERVEKIKKNISLAYLNFSKMINVNNYLYVQ